MMDAIRFLIVEHEFLDFYTKCPNTNANQINYFKKYKEYKSNNDYAGMIKTLETWLLYYPIKSKQDAFLEKFPNARLDADGTIDICPQILFGESVKPDCRGYMCASCRQAFWSSKQQNN